MDTSSGSRQVGSDLEIARQARMRPIAEVAARLDIPVESLHPHGHHIGKVDGAFVDGLETRPDGRLILVTAITPTPAGEGKTTTTIGLGDGLNRIGKRTAICIREPSLGPCFGMKGGAAGGGYAQVVPMEQINLHFTGDFHAITTAHNLLAAMLDNHLHWGNALGIDQRRVTWRRVLDMNDRALRDIVIGLGGHTNSVPREDGFDITVASEIMAIFCLSKDFTELRQRLGDIIVGYTHDREPVRCRDLEADGAMTVLLMDAFMPNLVQTLENNPVFVHGGPFANIAHGCNSVRATRAALKLADYTVTEAGFGADLGAEKFFDIKCRHAGLKPDMAVVVATVRALKMHGGVAKGDLGQPNVAAVKAGLANLGRHLENVAGFGVPVAVAINHFIADTDEEVAAVMAFCEGLGVPAFLCRHWAEGSAGIEPLAQHVARTLDGAGASGFAPLYDLDGTIQDRVTAVAQRIYRADGVEFSSAATAAIRQIERLGYGNLPVCIAKTQYSFSSDPALLGAPAGHQLQVREVRLSAGAGFVVVICGDIMTMPGLPRVPAANHIHIGDDGRIQNLS